ncbi:hypothetical protein EMCRGX_G011080 [Ephydatia muelleri]
MVLVAGIGIGLFVLIIIWTLTIVAVFVLAAVPKMRYGIPVVVAVTVLISLLLILYPRDSSSVTTAVQGVDEIFFGRLTLLIKPSLRNVIIKKKKKRGNPVMDVPY